MENLIFYILIATAILTALASLATLNIYVILFSCLVIVVMFFFHRLWDVFEALIINRTGVVQLIGTYELEGERLCAIKEIGKEFQAISAATLRDFPKKELTKENIERIIAGSNSPFRLVVGVERLNTSKIIDGLKTRRRMKEIELTKAKQSKGKDNSKVIEREISVIEDEITAISTGSVPLKTEIYLLSAARAESKFLAQEHSIAQIRELSGEFSAVLGASFEVISGSELVRLVKSDALCLGV